MAGGVFAVLKDFFFENGAYDDGFECWGTENLEISFRTWMCGGSVECVPCSRVFHLFRSGGFAYKCDPNAVLRNKVRTLMWMDEYAELAWNVLGRPNIDYHDDTLELRRQWRKDHNCKSFQWYMDTVFPGGDVRNLDDVPYLGKIVNVASSNCLFYSNNSPGASIHILPCEEDQHFEFIYFKRRLRIIPLTNDEACLVNEGKFVWCARSIECEWMYDGKLLMNKGLCLSGEGNKFLMVKCNEEDMNQVWNWQRYVPAENFIVPLLTDST
ncbi:hypothetical protein IE077_003971 [Cardiosporidium cionae]|uniref:Ricin B lectin domain-containing protein n=1 Tax=Cardiosporidium cionae TaxID=476202 RepID=A0ABQ7J3Z7_9APIC|nr:hypothetical protein IE077_003971 [Cardiosporidium cionae]|eukprot:KAF8817828.1 hypothetical protein IE077_003971 [Cardiosporidium cionae]